MSDAHEETLYLIDSHCHVHDSEFFDEQREDVYARAVKKHIGMICVGTDERSSAEAVMFAREHHHTWAAVGVHPHDTRHGWSGIRALLADGVMRPHIVAVGEIGLDYYYNNSPRDVQIQALEAQIQLALDYDLPITFHVRDAFDDFWPVFDNFHGVCGVLHSFTDTMSHMERALSNDLYIGLNGISTFTRDQAQKDMYRAIPLDRIVFETDAPFLTPAPFRGNMNEPAYVELVAEFWAKQRDIAPDVLYAQTVRTTKAIFGL